MRSRRSGPGRPLGDTKVSGRRVTCKAPLAHLEEGSGRSKTSPTAIVQGTHSLEGVFSERSGEPQRMLGCDRGRREPVEREEDRMSKRVDGTYSPIALPPVPLEEWKYTKETLHRYAQIVGKVRLERSPFRNH